MAKHPLPLDVGVEPLTKTGPRTGERLMGQLDDVLVARHEACIDQLVDKALALVVGDDGLPGDPIGHRVALRRRRDEAQHQVAQQQPLLRRDLPVHLLRRLGDGPTDPPRLPVGGDRQRAILAACPRLAQGMGQQRQGAGFAFHLAHEHLDEPRLQEQPVLPGRRLDRRS